MRHRSVHRLPAWLIAAGLLVAAAPCHAQGDYQARLEQYQAACQAFDEEASAYWQAIADKRRTRNEKRRN